MAQEKPVKPEESSQAAPGPDKKEAEMELTQHEEHPMPLTPEAAAVPLVRSAARPEEKLTATYSGPVGFFRLACFVVVRRVKLSQMKATLSRLQKDRRDAYVALGRRALEMKLSHAEIAPLASQLEALDPEVAALRDQIGAVEGVPLPDDPDIRKAELNLRKVKTGKLNEAIQAIEAKAQPILDQVGHIVCREKMEPQALEPHYGRIQGAEAEITAQERRLSDTEEEYEAVSSGTRALAYGFWVAVVVIILAILLFATRGGSSTAKKTSLGPVPGPPAESERLG